MKKKGIVSVICMTVGLVFILVAFFSPWYSIEIKSSIGGESNVYQDFYLTKIEMHDTFAGVPIRESMDYDVIQEGLELTQGLPVPEEVNIGFKEVEQGLAMFDTTRYLTIGILITSILALIGILGFVLGKANEMRKIGIIFGIVTFILAIIVVCYFAIGVTLYGGGLWNTMEQYGTTASSSPGYAWYLMIIAGITSLISSVVIYKTPVPTEEKQREKIIKTIKCPSCGETQEVQGVLGERVEVTCKKCNGKGVFHFR